MDDGANTGPSATDGVADPDVDLVLERVVSASPDDLWRAWTESALLTRWFTPAPWVTVHAEVDPRPGGTFRTIVRSPEGEESDGTGCVLAAEPGRRFAWTNALGPRFRPVELDDEDFPFTVELTFTSVEGGTRYRAVARHASAGTAAMHAEVGFHDGWGAALDQLLGVLAAD